MSKTKLSNFNPIIFTATNVGANDKRLFKLIKFYGLRPKIININYKDDILQYFERIRDNNTECIFINLKSLVKILKDNLGNDFASILYAKFKNIFFYDLSPSIGINSLLKYFTNDQITSLYRFDSGDYHYEISKNHCQITKELSGFSFQPINHTNDFYFCIEKNGFNIKKVININNNPFFVYLKNNNCNIFLIATNKIANIDTGFSNSDNINHYFSQIIPYTMFIKYVFQDNCWHNESNYANFIIDDPLLKPKYGFLDYFKLIKTIEKNNCTSTVAFIPWNYKRCNKETVDLFRKNSNKLSLCIHGCNHTKAEFKSNDSLWINWLVKLAIDRMSKLKQREGLGLERIMIFPQGLFSKTAMKILKRNRFLASVNSADFLKKEYNNKFKISDYLDIAINKYFHFPLFLRRYPTNLPVIALDAFLGKPLLFVEHHCYFRDSRFEEFIRNINIIMNPIKWDTLGNVIKNAHVQKVGPGGEIYWKIYANKAIIQNRTNKLKRYKIIKIEDKAVPIKGVLINNKIIPYKLVKNILLFYTVIKGNETARIEILYKEDRSKIKLKPSFEYRLKVFIRRMLSEVRDNYINRITYG